MRSESERIGAEFASEYFVRRISEYPRYAKLFTVNRLPTQHRPSILTEHDTEVFVGNDFRQVPKRGRGILRSVYQGQ